MEVRRGQGAAGPQPPNCVKTVHCWLPTTSARQFRSQIANYVLLDQPYLIDTQLSHFLSPNFQAQLAIIDGIIRTNTSTELLTTQSADQISRDAVVLSFIQSNYHL